MSTINNTTFRPAFGSSKTVAKIAKEVLALPKTTVVKEEIALIANKSKMNVFEKAIYWLGQKIAYPLIKKRQ